MLGVSGSFANGEIDICSSLLGVGDVSSEDVISV